MTNKQQAVRDEVMSVMRERSVDAGYSTIRVGLKSISNELCKDTNITEQDVSDAVESLLTDCYLIRNGAHTMDIGKADYFADHERDPDALKQPAEVEAKPELEAVKVVNASEALKLATSKPDELQQALTNLQTRLSPIADKKEKLLVLEQLAKYLHPTIAAVLDDIAKVIDSMEAA